MGITDWTARAWNNVTTKASAAVDGVKSAAVKAGQVPGNLFDGAKNLVADSKIILEDHGGVWGATKAIYNETIINRAATKVVDGAFWGWENKEELAEFAMDNPGRASELVLQGATNSVAQLAGGTVGLAQAVLWDHTGRHIANTYFSLAQTPFKIANLGRAEEDQIKIRLIDKHDHTYADDLQEAWQWGFVEEIDIDNENAEYERVFLYGSQAVGEFAAFVAGTALTGGVAGAAMAAARGGKITQTACQFARTSKAWSLPLKTNAEGALVVSKTAVGIEAAGMTYAYNSLRSRAQAEEDAILDTRAEETESTVDELDTIFNELMEEESPVTKDNTFDSNDDAAPPATPTEDFAVVAAMTPQALQTTPVSLTATARQPFTPVDTLSEEVAQPTQPSSTPSEETGHNDIFALITQFLTSLGMGEEGSFDQSNFLEVITQTLASLFMGNTAQSHFNMAANPPAERAAAEYTVQPHNAPSLG